MLFLNQEHIEEKRIDWDELIAVIENAVRCMIANDFAQPLKPYLRYRNRKNRIIAMPAFVGGNVNKAGIKWIASFPGNIDKGIPRAHSVVILNDGDTGEPVAIICTALLSIMRTASVSALLIKKFHRHRKKTGLKIGIIGFGPIGQYHLKMCRALLGEAIESINVFDIRKISARDSEGVNIVSRWEDAYLHSDIVITCTVSDGPYIDKMPKKGSLHLNVSLRDYKTNTFEWFKDGIIVDSWEEVCREKTDIEMMHHEKGLQEKDTKSIIDVVEDECLRAYSENTPIMFNPMGMSVFDIAMANFYYEALRNTVTE